MHVALIPPVSMMRSTHLTYYQLMLPQVAANSPCYADKYDSHCKDPNQFVILDNGAAEGVLWDTVQLMRTATKYRPQEVVIPDVIGDSLATIDRAMAFYDDVVPPRSIGRLPFSLMFVVQGQSLMEVLKCAEWALGQEWIDTIGIPRHMLDTLKDLKARSRIANTLQGKANCKPIHFLGANTAWPAEVEILSSPWHTVQTHLRGIDTSLPYTLAFHDRKIDACTFISDEVRVSRPDHYFTQVDTEFPRDIVDYNIQEFMRMARANVTQSGTNRKATHG